MLPGINILLGLPRETPRTLQLNLDALRQLLDGGLLIRRINIRRVVRFPGTPLYDRPPGPEMRRNHLLYPDWIERVRHEIDMPMLRRLYPPSPFQAGDDAGEPSPRGRTALPTRRIGARDACQSKYTTPLGEPPGLE